GRATPRSRPVASSTATSSRAPPRHRRRSRRRRRRPPSRPRPAASRCRRSRSPPVRLIDRRIGVLFAVFLLLFVVAVARAAWVQGVQGGGLAADARSQQTETATIPGIRGRILDRRGHELAVSEDAADVVATPYELGYPNR